MNTSTVISCCTWEVSAAIHMKDAGNRFKLDAINLTVTVKDLIIKIGPSQKKRAKWSIFPTYASTQAVY